MVSQKMDSLFTTIRLCQNQIEAEMLKLKLSTEGIEAEVLDQSASLGFGGLSPKSDGLRLQVLTSDAARAEEILDALDAESEEE